MKKTPDLRLVVLIALMVVAIASCSSDDSGGVSLDDAKATVCADAPGWEATLTKIAAGEGSSGDLTTEVASLQSGISDAATALGDAGAENLATAAESLNTGMDDLASSLQDATSGAPDKANEALSGLEALTKLAGC